ncbi:hypothetical protein A3A39_04350 [Candidatus Kaiserbacteria bacterium RIFCSPLOWO2_01_FULL_54_13]|uniref:DNA polymerase III delta N-terminal domain-containing protein n=1 Tax=Candidatus Kaiserbacteria bacterium RIFCSPLOWO2_01_FULL_54_13 TaxID=1798512 RepID=A0A1F6F1H9_9BACT|nr:MAG: hypothetical protein A3A39_04350 [Candidatus Kaiserbacteria bacterium RIFCSPLOWO2_01_FULL_54_13]
MLHVYLGTDRQKARAEMSKALTKEGKKSRIVRITDANSVADLQEALRGSGMFGEKRVVVLDGVFANEEMQGVVISALPHIKKSNESFFILEGKLDAETRRILEKHAETVEKFDAKREKEGGEIFALAYALKRGDKKALWVNYQRALMRDEAPEAIHGVLFWGAKDMLLRAKARSPEWNRGAKLVAELAELPHEARRSSFDLEYALEHYILGLLR